MADQEEIAALVCPNCGRTDFKAKIGYISHVRSHQPKVETPEPAPVVEPDPEPDLPDAEAPPEFEPVPLQAVNEEFQRLQDKAVAAVYGKTDTGKPAVLSSWRQATRLRIGQRSITMCDPRCHPCQTADNAPLNWYRNCPHDPYVTMTPVKEPPRYEDIFENGRPSGRKRLVEGEVIVSWIPTPNTREISLSMGANSGRGVEFARRKGFIMPSEVRSPHFPNGIAEACQFRDCKKQTGLKAYEMGTFCRPEEAQLVWHTETGTTLEVGEWNDEARQRRMNQLGAAQIGVGVPA